MAVIHTVQPKLTTYTLADTSRAYALYSHFPLPSKPQELQSLLRDCIEVLATINLPAGEWHAEWLDTKTGETTKQESFQHDGVKFRQGHALRLSKKD